MKPQQHPGILHQYAPRHVAFEHLPSAQWKESHKDILIFVGGLSDGLLTVPYIPHLARSLENFSVAETLLSSSYSGFGTSDLEQDTHELAQCVTYFSELRPDAKIVLMGHSTGCQDIMHYLTSPGQRPKINGAIMQAGISDREAFDTLDDPDHIKKGVDVARRYVREGRGNDVIPDYLTNMVFAAPVSAKRWLSLISPGPEHAGEDDYFSSDLDDERLKGTFGTIGKTGTPMLILFSGNDPHVPKHVDKQLLLNRWVRHIKEGGGVVDQNTAVIPGASHTLKELGQPMNDIFARVNSFLERIK
ncbi:MAG: hypothetical protein HETSPECPRED_004114 [Heterodermia speciosa]|uniref:DUF1749-domain-containing protein n=1 Tax=Heterodermia speciosa TaxID=116794 RepID=A0A8H3FD03_9LECA|nr:MAG: hypothetical protein HETSPECPRED_004114 [Heterodermia speciosa]